MEKNWDYELPELRAKVASLEGEISVRKRDSAEQTKAYYSLINRVKELTEERDLLLKQLEEMRNTHIPLR